MRTITATVPLSRGSVALRAWGAHQTDALMLDLMTVTATLAEFLSAPPEGVTVDDIEAEVWGSFQRLLSHSLDGTLAPTDTTLSERVQLLGVMWELNDMTGTLSKLAALGERAGRAMAARLADAQGRPEAAQDDGRARAPDNTTDELLLREFSPAEYEALRRQPPALIDRALQIRRETAALRRLEALDDASIASGLSLGREHVDPKNKGGPKPGEPYITHEGLKKHRTDLDKQARPWAYTAASIWAQEEDEFSELAAAMGGAVLRA